MFTQIFAISPKNKIKINVGYIDHGYCEAHFKITPLRYFTEARAFGVDEAVFKKKAVNFCKTYVFHLWNGKTYSIKKTDFLMNCWIYQPKESELYKARSGEFCPKLMIQEDRAAELSKAQKQNRDEEILKAAIM